MLLPAARNAYAQAFGLALKNSLAFGWQIRLQDLAF
jgi:hypothetical protein